MIDEGAVLYGFFNLKNEDKNKFAVVLHKNEDDCIITSFTTSQDRHPANPSHGANPSKTPNCYVFLAGRNIGTTPDGKPYSFKETTTIVPDYGMNEENVEVFLSKVQNLEKKCDLYKNEYLDLLYTLYKCDNTKMKYLPLLENKIEELSQ